MAFNIFARAWRWLRYGRSASEIDDEMRLHLEFLTRQYEEEGMPPAEAADKAQRRFGNVQRLYEECHEALLTQKEQKMETLLKDIRYSLRLMRRQPAFTVVVVLTLALGIGANTAIFSVVDALLLRSLPFHDASELVLIFPTDEEQRLTSVAGYPDFQDWRRQAGSFEDMACFRNRGFVLTGMSVAERLQGKVVSSNFFNLLHVKPFLGRDFTPEDDQPGGALNVIVSYGFWQRIMGGDPNLTDRTITLDGNLFNVIGVLPREFSFPVEDPGDTTVWTAVGREGDNLQARGARLFHTIGRLQAGHDFAGAQAELATIGKRLQQEYPDTNAGMTLQAHPLRDYLMGDLRNALVVLVIAVGFVLLIACANVANLLLVRASARQKELAIRAAIGAGRSRIIRQLLTESLMLALIAGVAALALAAMSIHLLQNLERSVLPSFNPIQLNAEVFLFAFAASVFTGAVCGYYPARKASRPNVFEVLKESGRGNSGRRGGIRELLVVTEVALALMLLVGAGLLVKSMASLTRVNPGFQTDNLLNLRVNLPSRSYPEPAQRLNLYRQFITNIEALPGVESAAYSSTAPFSGFNISSSFTEGGVDRDAYFRVISPNYFETMGIRLLKGRQFTEHDDKRALGAVIINQAMAHAFWPDEEPLGKVLRELNTNVDPDEPKEWQIVGLVEDVKSSALDIKTMPEFYIPVAQKSFNSGNFEVRTSSDPLSLISAVRQELAQLDPDLPIYNIGAVDQMIAQTYAERGFYTALLAAFSALGLLLALIGIYGVMSYTVTERTHEMGIRMALGAEPKRILRMVVHHGLVMAMLGIGVGMIGAFVLTRLLSTLLFQVSSLDPMIFATVPLAIIAVAVAAAWLPARKATQVDPIIALRAE
jgi:putative ABC transport system permease protein